MKILKGIIRSRLFQNLLFWAVSFFVLMRLFTRTGETRLIDVIYTLLFHIPMIAAVCIHSFILIPGYLQKRKYRIYTLMLVPLYGITWGVYYLTFNFLSDLLFPGFYFVALYSPLEIFGFMVIFVGITSLLEFSKSWFNEQQTKTKLAELEREKKSTELRALRAQINPHFLFNSLNTIYSETLKKSEKAPRLILMLSDMLRYVVDKMDKEEVSLDKEIEYLSNYISLQKERVGKPHKVTFKTEGETNGLSIAPLLLIIFIENSFKHASLLGDDDYISVHISIHDQNLILFTENSVNTETGNIEKTSGYGIQNARRRLELVYPDAHELHIFETGSVYKTTLNLSLNVHEVPDNR